MAGEHPESRAVPQAPQALPYASREADRRTLACPKCGGPMARGFVADHSDHNAIRQSRWVEGVPEQGFLGFLTGLRTRGKTALYVHTYRCGHCGYLESYATEPVLPAG